MDCTKILSNWSLPAEFQGEAGRLNGRIAVSFSIGTVLAITSFVITVLLLAEVGLPFYAAVGAWGFIAGCEIVLAWTAVDAFLEWKRLS